MMQTNPEMIRSFREKGRKAYGKVFIMRSPKYEPLHHADSKNYRTKYFRDIEDLRVDFQITDDMVSIASTSGTIPIGVLIKHREITQAFGQIFEELWNRTEG